MAQMRGKLELGIKETAQEHMNWEPKLGLLDPAVSSKLLFFSHELPS